MWTVTGAQLHACVLAAAICCPSRTEFFSGRYYHNIGPPGDPGGCMHVDTANAVHPLTVRRLHLTYLDSTWLIARLRLATVLTRSIGCAYIFSSTIACILITKLITSYGLFSLHHHHHTAY